MEDKINQESISARKRFTPEQEEVIWAVWLWLSSNANKNKIRHRDDVFEMIYKELDKRNA